ncbi:copper resistance protein CopC [Candidatus Daviesbacteria bacterium]|nr:copper resistance protein CopC [Candidatus Daviesbacteria bacterium]
MRKVGPILALGIFLIAIFLILKLSKNNSYSITQTQTPQPTASALDPRDFGPPSNTAHFIKSIPTHKATLSKLPDYIEIDFDAPLKETSNLTIENGDDQYVDGDTIISADKLSMKRKVDHLAPDGRYYIAYSACFTNSSDCLNGYFKFAVDRSLK